MKATATAAEVRKYFVIENIDEATKTIAEKVSEDLSYESSIDLMVSAISTVSQEEQDDLALIDKMVCMARQCYLMGFIRAFQISSEAAKMNFEELFQPPPNKKDDVSCAVSPCLTTNRKPLT